MTVVVSETDSGTKKKVILELKESHKRMKKAVREELETVWQKIWEDAVNLCPKDTGALASSIKVVKGGTGAFGIAHGAGEPVLDIYITAGDPSIVNPKTGKTTDYYASLVHEGHRMRDGTFWAGVAFLTEAILNNWNELDAAMAKALKELDKGV